ncbi:MAG: acyl-CoA thioesterase [Hyphomicrobiaceae bacterium]
MTTQQADLERRGTFPFFTTEKVRFGDIDRQNHVNNLAICSYIECGRVEMREVNFPEIARDPANAWLVVHFEVSFMASTGYPGTVDVGTAVVRIGTSSYVLGHGVFAGDTCLATARTTTVFGDRAAGGKRPIPDNLRAELEKLRARV